MKNVTDTLRYDAISASIPIFDLHSRVEAYVQAIISTNIWNNIQNNIQIKVERVVWFNSIFNIRNNIENNLKPLSKTKLESAYNILETL